MDKRSWDCRGGDKSQGEAVSFIKGPVVKTKDGGVCIEMVSGGY